MAAPGRCGARQTYLRAETRAVDFAADGARMFRASWVMSGGLMRPAYPAPPRGTHKGMPLRCVFGVPCDNLVDDALGGLVVIVVHTWTEMGPESERPVGRIISARKAVRLERKEYEEGHG